MIENLAIVSNSTVSQVEEITIQRALSGANLFQACSFLLIFKALTVGRSMGLLRRKLLNGDRKVAVWGTGYIGFSTMANFAVNGVACLGTDVVQSIVDTINQGRVPIPNLEYWLGFPVEPLVESGMMRATTNWKELLNEEVAVLSSCDLRLSISSWLRRLRRRPRVCHLSQLG